MFSDEPWRLSAYVRVHTGSNPNPSFVSHVPKVGTASALTRVGRPLETAMQGSGGASRLRQGGGSRRHPKVSKTLRGLHQ